MYTIYVELDLARIPADRADAMMAEHRVWFKEYFDKGTFLMLGPCPDVAGAGLIIAQGESKEAMEELIKTDVYYADGLAKYTIHEFDVKMFNPKVGDYVG